MVVPVDMVELVLFDKSIAIAVIMSADCGVFQWLDTLSLAGFR
jgi:hypothetical protein